MLFDLKKQYLRVFFRLSGSLQHFLSTAQAAVIENAPRREKRSLLQLEIFLRFEACRLFQSQTRWKGPHYVT